ncbi:VanZ family protein [Kerstersia gyiorum]|uniref:VanZ family protein n=2 Tax=Kerstersia gyiorum TaxID=206506 RepID=A0A4Q7MQF2_9BURK|nr:VanZ family protein [Kerstersia gyiorum]RZS70001.1 VanZ family protein [Kerstersia gyiorum]
MLRSGTGQPFCAGPPADSLALCPSLTRCAQAARLAHDRFLLPLLTSFFMAQSTLDRLALAATLALLVIISFLTLASPGSLPRVAGGDKLHHALAFAALVFPVVVARPAWALRAFIGAVAYGGLIELVQPSFGRAGEWADLIADTIGAAAGVVLAWLTRWVLPIRSNVA